MLKINLSKDDKRVANAATDDMYRPGLSYVYFRAGRMFASDGFMIAIRKTACEVTTSIPAKILRIYRDAVSIRRTSKHIMVDLPKRVDVHSQNEFEDMEKVSNTILVNADKTIAHKATVAISADMLEKAIACLPVDKKHTEPIKFFIGERTDPVRLEYGDTTVVVMPCYVEW